LTTWSRVGTFLYMPRRPAHPASSIVRPAGPRVRTKLLLVGGILLLAAGAFYAALVVALQIQQIVVPGSNIHVHGIAGNLPGLGSSDSESQAGSTPINILVLSMDETRAAAGGDNWGLTRPGGWLNDVSFVMRIDPVSKTARGLAVPRDLYVDIPTASGQGTIKDRINTAYAYGEARQPGSGPALAEKVFGQVLGIKIDHYVIIDFEGFKKVIDLLGGIDLEVPTAINDPHYSDTELLGDYYPCVFSVGAHHMNGKDALCYARTRFNSNDLDRIFRQQRVI
jgi:LCP family protein required for cell wall assembly